MSLRLQTHFIVAVFITVFAAFSVSAKAVVALLPLDLQPADSLNSWTEALLPEQLFHSLRDQGLFRVWDPVFLAGADSTTSRAQDSLFREAHRLRWGWDAAVGGTVRSIGDSLVYAITVDRFNGRSYTRVHRVVSIPFDKPENGSGVLSYAVLQMLGVSLSPAESLLVVNRKPGLQGAAFRTYLAGYRAEMRKESSRAASAYLRTIELDSRAFGALLRLGKLFDAGGDPLRARLFFERAFAVSPEELSAAALLSMESRFGDTRVADAFVNKQSVLLERGAEGLFALGSHYLQQGEYQRAIATLVRAVAAGPCDLETDFVLGRAYLLSCRFDESADLFSRLVGYRPDHAPYYSFLGAAYRGAGRLMESVGVLERIDKRGDNDVGISLNLSMTYAALGRFDRARDVLVAALREHPLDSRLNLNLGTILARSGSLDSAQARFVNSAGDVRTRQAVLANQANALMQAQETDKAISKYRAAVKAGARNEIILSNLARALIIAGRAKEAIAELDEVLLLAPQRLDILEIQARLSLATGDLIGAENCVRKILDGAPGDRRAIDILIAVLDRQGRLREAVDVVEAYLADFPQDADYRILLPEIYRKIGWFDAAITWYRILLADADLSKNASLHLSYARCLLDMIAKGSWTDFEQAIYYAKMAIQENPADPAPDLLIATIYLDYRNYRDLGLDHLMSALGKEKDPARQDEIRRRIRSAQ